MVDIPYQGSTYLTETFRICSYQHEVSKKGRNREPDSTFHRKIKIQSQILSGVVFGKKVSNIDLQTLDSYFEKYCKAVNLILERVYCCDKRVERIGESLKKNRSHGYHMTTLKKKYKLAPLT